MKFIFAFFVFIFVTPTQAFILLNADYRLANPEEVKVNIASGGCRGNGISNDELKGYLAEAIDDYWNTVTESRLFLELGDETSDSVSSSSPAGVILVGCASLGATANGVAIANNENNGCRIQMNSDTFVPGGFTKEGFMGTLIHEMGHCVGLHHSDDPASVMTYRSQPFVQPKALAKDDKDGVVYLYPYESKALLFGGCSATAAVPGEKEGKGIWSFLFLLALGFVGVFLGGRVINSLQRKF